MTARENNCPDCSDNPNHLDRRRFLQSTAGAVAAASLTSVALAAPDSDSPAAESYVKQLYENLSEQQRKEVCFDWDFVHPKRGLLRTHVSNNWQITRPTLASDFFTKDQQELVRAVYENLYSEEWVPKIDKQLQDDAGGYGNAQCIAMFGKPGDDKFEFVMTGRHLTMRCDGNTAEHVAFGGPIFYGHDAAGDFYEEADHPGNVFWPQAVEANKVFDMLDGKQRDLSLVQKSPHEAAVAFRGADGEYPGISVADLSSDQQEQVTKVMAKLLEPYRTGDQSEVMQCLKAQGGLEACSLSFYKDSDVGNNRVWDNWRLEGPSLVWYFRGAPHVHVWANVASDPSVKLNAKG